ncbi:MAG: hypothetical protein J6W39_08305, partial [Spirochaetales bacterium]|nr:hypothetical protein [Spirochaetales bacterium]
MKKSIPIILLSLAMFFISCTQQPEKPAEDDEMMLPISIYDLQGEFGSRAIEVEGNPLDDEGVPTEILNIYYPSFAGLEKKSVGSEPAYEMKMLDRTLTCSIS